MNVTKEVGRKIRALRTEGKNRHPTQEATAGRAGISVSFLSMIERGERSPGLDTLAAIASALQVPLAELFRFDSDPDKLDQLHRPIVEFCRKRTMTTGDMERLLAIAKAAFD